MKKLYGTVAVRMISDGNLNRDQAITLTADVMGSFPQATIFSDKAVSYPSVVKIPYGRTLYQTRLTLRLFPPLQSYS